MDPHKRSATMEIINDREQVFHQGCFGTDRDGYRQMLGVAREHPNRLWAIEGCNGIGRHLAQTVRDTGRELIANHKQLRQLVASIAPELLAKRGIGPVSAAQAIISWSHPGRCRSEAAYARLAGAPPIPASSGKTVRHRLNRGGDRQLNAALHTIAMTRWRSCPRTADYITRRRAEGKTDREIRRILKRYIAREIYRTLNAATAA
jgi:transposase